MSPTRFAITLLALSLGAVALAGCGGGDVSKAGGAAAPLSLRIGTYDTPGWPGADQVEEFARQVEMLSGGKLRVEPVWKVAGPDSDDWDQQVAREVASGELEAGMIPARAWDTEGVTSLRALHAPFLVTSDELLDRIVTGELAAEMLAGLDEAGVVGLALLPESLRHPFGYDVPLLAPEDYAGALLRVPLSDVAYDLFAALGATPDDLIGAELNEAIAAGSVAGGESSFAIASSLQAGGTVATGNVTFFPKANTLVVNADVLAGLSDEERAILEEAAARTLTWAVEATPTDAEAAQAFCDRGGAVVLADEPDVAALEQAAAPVYRDLQSDPETKSLIEAIRALKSEVPVSARSAPAPCDGQGGGAESAAVAPDVESEPAFPEGMYRAEHTVELLIEHGIDPLSAHDWAGINTLTFQGGRWVHHVEGAPADTDCGGPYGVEGERISIFVGPDLAAIGCGAEGSLLFSARWTLAGDELRFSELNEGDAIWNATPWTKIG